MKSLIKRLLIGLIQAYRALISPLFPPTCRFQPTCSQYAIEAIDRFGIWRGSGLAVRRILRCHPFHPGGYDPVPPLSGSTFDSASDSASGSAKARSTDATETACACDHPSGGQND